MRSVRIGLIIPQRGSAGLWAPSAEACGRLAVTELNRTAGIRRRHVELLVIDAGATGASAGRAAREAVDELAVDGLVGMLPSYARDPVAKAARGRVPFVYTPQFEGLPADSDVMTTGETADPVALGVQARPALLPVRQRLHLAALVAADRQAADRAIWRHGHRRVLRAGRRA